MNKRLDSPYGDDIMVAGMASTVSNNTIKERQAPVVNTSRCSTFLRRGSALGGSMKKIPLTRGYEAIVDDKDYDELMKHKWSASTPRTAMSAYAARVKKKDEDNPGQYTMMHQAIIGIKAGLEIDHVNRNGLDNRRANLRHCTRAQNTRNVAAIGGASGYKGVSWNTQRRKWTSQIQHDYHSIYLGAYFDEEEAALAYDKKARELHGEFARCNFPMPGDSNYNEKIYGETPRTEIAIEWDDQ